MSPESASVLHRFVSLAKEPDYLASVARRCFAWPTARVAASNSPCCFLYLIRQRATDKITGSPREQIFHPAESRGFTEFDERRIR